MNFSGKVALVTGAGSPQGIGYATAQLLAQQGAAIAITSTTDRIHDRACELADTGANVFAAPADLGDHQQAHAFVQQVFERFAHIDILVNNAGMIQVGNPAAMVNASLVDMSEKDWDYGMAINLKSCYSVTQAVLPGMLSAGYGRIINVSSTTGPVASIPRDCVYSAAKAGMVGFARSLALEVARKGITVNAVAPGWIDTASATEHERIAGKNTPVGRSGFPSEVAAAIVFLASESASYITGQLIVVDGGNSIQEYKGPSELWH